MGDKGAEVEASEALLRYHAPEMAKRKEEVQAGMFVEAIDPLLPKYILPCKIKEVTPLRMRLNVLNESESTSFWVNKDSHLIFHCGFCITNGRSVHSARGLQRPFIWNKYLRQNGLPLTSKARAESFATLPTLFNSNGEYDCMHEFKNGMKLEAADPQAVEKVCVATVENFLHDSVLLHYDGYASVYDCWVSHDSPIIRPAGWFAAHPNEDSSIKFCAPPMYEKNKVFSWSDYSSETGARLVELDSMRSSISLANVKEIFPIGRELCVVDPYNPAFIRLAQVIECKNGFILLRFDGWDNGFDFWIPADSWNIFSEKYLISQGEKYLKSPIYLKNCDNHHFVKCPFLICEGLGNSKGYPRDEHSVIEECPYYNAMKSEYVSRRGQSIDQSSNADEAGVQFNRIGPIMSETVKISIQSLPQRSYLTLSEQVALEKLLSVGGVSLIEQQLNLTKKEQNLTSKKPEAPVKVEKKKRGRKPKNYYALQNLPPVKSEPIEVKEAVKKPTKPVFKKPANTNMLNAITSSTKGNAWIKTIIADIRSEQTGGDSIPPPQHIIKQRTRDLVWMAKPRANKFFTEDVLNMSLEEFSKFISDISDNETLGNLVLTEKLDSRTLLELEMEHYIAYGIPYKHAMILYKLMNELRLYNKFLRIIPETPNSHYLHDMVVHAYRLHQDIHVANQWPYSEKEEGTIKRMMERGAPLPEVKNSETLSDPWNKRESEIIAAWRNESAEEKNFQKELPSMLGLAMPGAGSSLVHQEKKGYGITGSRNPHSDASCSTFKPNLYTHREVRVAQTGKYSDKLKDLEKRYDLRRNRLLVESKKN